MVLEKPVELLRDSKNIAIHYCFAWANESWTKTWHGAGGAKEILIPQTYGGIEEWEGHYAYFRKFFFDERYIKENGCPVLLIYRLKNIPHFNDMIRYWDKCAKADGFRGIYIVSMNVCREHVEKSKWVSASVDFEPNKTRYERLGVCAGGIKPQNRTTFLWNRFAVSAVDYDSINKHMLQTPHKKGQFRGVFVGYDDSPRRNARALITKGVSPRKFGKYLQKALALSKSEQNEYVFLNAWNEWGEGNYLEPDTRYGYAYLNEVKKCKGCLEW